MVSRILNSLAARRNQLTEKEKGFTLIELLVVVIIIGILAAIAIPVYLGVQDSAKDSGTKSDLANAKIAVVGIMTDDSTLTYATAYAALFTGGNTVTEAGIKYGATISGNTVSISNAGSATTPFCLVGQSRSSGNQQFNATDKGVLKGATCGANTASSGTAPTAP